MADDSCRGNKRKPSDGDLLVEPLPKVTLLSPSLLLLQIPADTDSSLPVWEAMRSRQVDVKWTVSPYSVSVQLMPVTSKQKNSTPPRKTVCTSSVVQTSVLFPSILQPQMAIQSNTHASENSSVLLSFSQNAQSLPCPPSEQQKVPPNPTPATSFIVPLPLIITQPQPVHQATTPAKKGALTTTKTPTRTPTMLETLSSLFHTRSSFGIQICDNFLLSLCQAGTQCTMHHTPYPFHWQLWNSLTHQWVDISLPSQVILEKLYCDVNQEAICLKDGLTSYHLNLDLMEVEEPSKYDAIRRLTNSDRNPYFPSQWKIYWWNDFRWEEYSKDVSSLLLAKMNEKEPECSFFINSQEYRVDFTTMTQINITTRFHREVRCRPVYRPPESMLPYLRTGIQLEFSQPGSDLPHTNFSVDPLEEFSSWYPPVWTQVSGNDYQLVDVPAGTQAYRRVQNLFNESVPDSWVKIISIQQVQNLLHWDKYQRHKVYMQKQEIESKEPLERHLFHGTTRVASEDICLNNFDPRVAGVNGTSLGLGAYFATSASYSHRFSPKDSDEARHMFLAKVLVGKVSLGKHTYRRPPPLYDACVDNMDSPTMFVVFNSCQCYPYYLIKYKDVNMINL